MIMQMRHPAVQEMSKTKNGTWVWPANTDVVRALLVSDSGKVRSPKLKLLAILLHPCCKCDGG